MVFEIPITTEEDPLFKEGKSLLGKGEYTKARETFELSYSLRAKNYGEESQEALEALLYLSLAYATEENIEKSLEEAYSFLSRNPQNKRQILICKYIIGQDTCQIDLTAGLPLLEEARRYALNEVEEPDAILRNIERDLGRNYAKAGNCEKGALYLSLALQKFKQEQGNSPTYFTDLLYLVQLYYLSDQAEEALSAIEEWRSLDGDKEDLFIVYYFKGISYAALKRNKEAVGALRKSLEYCPEEKLSSIFFELGKAYDELEEYKFAMKYFTLSYEEKLKKQADEEDLAYLLYRIGSDYANLKDYEEACKTFKKGLSSMKTPSEDITDLLLSRLAYTYYKAGDFKAAERLYYIYQDLCEQNDTDDYLAKNYEFFRKLKH